MMDAFLDWFERHKVGIIGTLTIHSMLLFFFTLMTFRAEEADEPLVEMNMEVMTPEEIKAIDERTGQQVDGPTTKVTNLTSNITAQQQQVARYFNSERLSERVESDLKGFEEAAFDSLRQARRERGDTVVMPQLDPSKWNKEQYMSKAAEPVKVEGATTVWHDLTGRTRENDVPGYLCRKEGRVAVTVAVDAGGTVTKAELDPSRSANADDCMIEHALSSTRRARFNSSGSAPDPQKGTVFFLFLRQ
jgi:hypothetical protein